LHQSSDFSAFRNFEGMFEKQRPEIESESCAKADEDGLDQGETWIVLELSLH